MSPFAVLSAATAAAVAVLLLSHARGFRAGVVVAKPLASSGFVSAAIVAGGTGTAYGRAVLVALGLSWIGDQFLLSHRKDAFLAGLGSFLLAHFAFAAAFWIRGVAPAWTVCAS